MVTHKQDPRRQRQTPEWGVSAAWHEERVASLDDAVGVVEALLQALDDAGYDRAARGRVRRVFEDAVLAALERGEPSATGQPLRLGYRVAPEYALAEVEGRGQMATPAAPAVQGPHRPLGAIAPGPRFYTWLRCDRSDGRVQACRCWFVS